MVLKDLFIEIMEGKAYDVLSVDTSQESIKGLIKYVVQTYSDQVECFNILSVDDSCLNEFLVGEDISLKIAAALSKLDRAIPHLRLKRYV